MKYILGWFFNKRLTIQFVLIGMFFVVVRVLIGSDGFARSIDGALLAPVVVLYSLFVSFVISAQRARYNEFFEYNRSESSVLYSLHVFSEALKAEQRSQITNLIDRYLIMQMDYRLKDFKETDRGFTDLAEYLVALKVSRSEQTEAKDKILDLIPSAQEKRYNMQTLISEGVARSEWVTILSLYAITIYSFLMFKTPDIVSVLIGALVCTASTMLVLILHKLDSLSYRSSEKIAEPIQRLFIDLGLMPYYSRPMLASGRVKPIEGIKVRVASYPNKYPDMAGKEV